MSKGFVFERGPSRMVTQIATAEKHHNTSVLEADELQENQIPGRNWTDLYVFRVAFLLRKAASEILKPFSLTLTSKHEVTEVTYLPLPEALDLQSA